MWAGSYGGLEIGRVSGGWHTNGIARSDLDFDSFGAFFGYNHALNSNMIVGGELAYSVGSFKWGAGDSSDLSNLDAKIRLGFASGDFLIYGFGGYSTTDEKTTNPAFGPYESSGWNVGAGVEFLVSSHVFLGLEYLHRETTWKQNKAETFETGTIGLRMGYKF